MMKWRVKTEAANIGVVELGELTFDDDCMNIALDICDMSDNLKAEIDKAVEIAKVKYIEERAKEITDHNVHPLRSGMVWSDKPVVMDFTYLSVYLEAGKPIDYRICIGFHDAMDKYMEQWDCAITVDLLAYEDELKKTIIKALIDKFF